ncbi:hypothetical protein JAAARDRAFT_39537 [Jaapia argillacea MUCL 33604]|uniref:PrpF protein n=1 Tax=Jaapia argillacea MUCL 33604 TaxID=933084 RepID=A0A067PEG4_9AGAM|nr:hypothetical protein JAAARDRAFT_39537 [Jaapia argillacea MUCL 33604]
MRFPNGPLSFLISSPKRFLSTRTTLNPLPATFLRGGTSKGIYINREHLPADRSQWDPIFLGIMGSPDPEYGRQLNGMGGGVSSLSKICVVGKPSDSQVKDGIDAEYTFVQVGIRDSSIDYSGNCGNLSSMIGVFAMDEGICQPQVVTGQTATIRSFNTNTNKRIDTTFPISRTGAGANAALDLPQVTVAGVSGKASQITLDFVSPGGARTGKLLPSGNPVDTIDIGDCEGVSPSTTHVRASLVDATNPTVFISSTDLQGALDLTPSSPIDYADTQVGRILEFIRRRGAERMGLDPSAQAQPKIAILSHPSPEDVGVHVVIHALSMGVLHKAVPMTVGLCLGVAARVEDTLAWDILATRQNGEAQRDLLTMKHPGGTVDVGAGFDEQGGVTSAKVVRTGRRLMKGVVWW